jgi:hypothetical protein
MKVEEGEEGGPEEGGRRRREDDGVNMTKVHWTHL